MYDSIADLVKKLVWKFVKKYGGDFDEWLSDANYAAVQAINTYDESRGAKLSTWVYNSVYFDLLTVAQNRIKQSKRNDVRLDFEPLTTDAVSRLSALMTEISEDAQMLLSCFFESDTRQRPTTVRKSIRVYLQSQGWNAHRMTKVLDEVRSALVETI